MPVERSIKPIGFATFVLNFDDVADDVAGGIAAHGRSELASLLLFQVPRTVTSSETQNNVRASNSRDPLLETFV